jgi:ankyrin repeat protein
MNRASSASELRPKSSFNYTEKRENVSTVPGAMSLDRLLKNQPFEKRRSARDGFSKHLSAMFGRISTGNESRKSGNLTDLLCDAAARGDTQFIGRVLGAGGDLRRRNKDGLTALHVAAMAGQQDSVRCLVRMGADVSAKDSNGYTALHHAVLSQQVHLIAQLANLGSNVNEKTSDGKTALHLAAELSDALNTSRPTSVSSCSSNKSEHNPRFSYSFGSRESPRMSTLSMSPDFTSSFGGLVGNSYDHCNAIEALVRVGGNLEITDKNGNTPLHTAALADRTRSIESLTKLGACSNTRNPQNQTALSILASSDDLNTVASRLLMENGATISPTSPLEFRNFEWPQRITRAHL